MIQIGRAYYTCLNKSCGHSEFPLDRILGLSSHSATGKFAEMVCYLAASMPFDQARMFVRRFEQVNITETMLRETAESCGAAFCASDEERAQSKIQPYRTLRSKTLYVEADGGMVPIRPENGGKTQYREAKVGVIFREEDIERKSNARGEQVCRVLKKRFATSIGQGVDHFEGLLKRAALEAGSARAQAIVFISDGADWIDGLRERLFPNAVHILDWYHATEHLWTCGKAIFGEKETARIEEWVRPLKQMLWDGVPEAVCDRLLFEMKKHRKARAQTAIIELHNYYKSRFDKMRYPQFRRLGYFIGSGAVECSHKYLVQARLKQAGMKWTINGASAIIRLRQMLYDGTWPEHWVRPAA